MRGHMNVKIFDIRFTLYQWASRIFLTHALFKKIL